MKKVKFGLALLLVTFLATMLYANVRRRSPSESIKPIHLAAFNISIKDADPEELRNTISGTAGVTSCSISREKDLVVITYHPDEISESELSKIVSNSGEINVSIKDLAANSSGSCPVHKLSASVGAWVKALDFRN
jgi:hypothetical protein